MTFYNAALLEEAGIDYTTIETWDDFSEAGATYHQATGKAFGVASTSVNFVEPLIVAQLGGNFFDEDGDVDVANPPDVVKAFEMQKAMLDAGAISTIPPGGSPRRRAGVRRHQQRRLRRRRVPPRLVHVALRRLHARPRR